MSTKKVTAPFAKATMASTAAVFTACALLSAEGPGAYAEAGATPSAGDVPTLAALSNGPPRMTARSATVTGMYPVKREVNDTAEPESVDEEIQPRLGPGDHPPHAPRPAAHIDDAGPDPGKGESLVTWAQGGTTAGHPACPGVGECFEPHMGLGCIDEPCCIDVCSTDSWCCEFQWDDYCVSLAQQSEACEEPQPDCREHATPGAIYSNWHPECWDVAVTQGNLVRADNLWWGDSGGLLSQLSFSIYNGTANVDNLTSATVEVILSTTIPGHVDGTLDLSTAIAIIEVHLDSLALPPGFGAVVTIEPEGDIVLPVPGINAGTRYMEATFDGPDSSINFLGSVIANPVALGLSHPRYFLEGTGNSVGLSSGTPGNYVWEIVADGEVGSRQVVFDNAPQQQVIGSGGSPTNGGFGSGFLTNGNMVWVTMPLVLDEVPDGREAWRVTGFYPHFFIPANAEGLVDTVHWVLWHRDGDGEPGEMIAEGALEYPMLEMFHPLNFRGARIHPIPVDLVLEPGEYFLSVYGSGSEPPARVAWFTNAANGIKMVDANGPFYWRATNYPGPWSKITTTFEPLPEQEDPDTITACMFFVIAEATGDVPPLCPWDLTGNGSVGVPDLLALLQCWGPVQPGCEQADFNGDDTVNVDDLLELICHWGPCNGRGLPCPR